eukprot:XP_001692521.1 predicted protein [Chlamydomonas reinhardtii]
MPLNQIKATQIMRVIVHMNAVAECVDESPDAGLKQELISALAHTQLLEHAAQALLHAAQATPAAPGIAAVASSAQEANEDWALLRLLEQLRPLLAGPCLQLVAAWAGLCAAMTVRQQADGGGAVQQGVAHARSHQGYGLPAELMRPLQPLRQAEAQKSSSHLAICVMVQALGYAIQPTVSGPCDLAIAQPSVGYDRLPHRQPQPQRPLAGPCAVATAAAAGAAGGSAAQSDAGAPFSAVQAYGLLSKVWYGLACDSSKHLRSLYLVALVMTRLLTELRPRRAAVLLPGWWRLLAQEPSMLIQERRMAQDAGELLQLQLNAPPPAAWAAGVTDAASVAAASFDWPPEPKEVQNTEAVIAAKAAASLARGRDPSYSLRGALGAGLLPVVERCLRAPQAWQQASSASLQLNVVNCVLRYSGVWPAVLARGPVQQAVSLIATLGAAARLLQEKDTLVYTIPFASQPSKHLVVECGASGYLCAYLSAMLEQVADVRALREGAQQQQQQQQQQREGQQEQEAPALQQAATAAGAAAPVLHLNSVLEVLVHEDGSVKPTACSIAWMAAAGGLPAAGSAADRQQQLLTSFAVYQWLPALAKATEEALMGQAAATERNLSQALMVGRLLMDVLWRAESLENEIDGGVGAETAVGGRAGAAGHCRLPGRSSSDDKSDGGGGVQ